MNIEKYETLYDSSNQSYSFTSTGPKGNIKKVVLFEKVRSIRGNIYNVTLGDWDEDKRRIDDLVVSNNSDSTKILYSVSLTILDFLSRFPDAEILITGSTNARIRLYQMSIVKNLIEIDKHFEIQGLKNGYWVKLKPGINFEAFLIKSREINL